MAQIVKELRVDVSQPNVFQAIVAKQLDSNSRFLKITLVDFGVKVEVPNTAKVTINANRPDGASESFKGEANNDGTITVPLAQWMLDIVGEVKCDVSVINTEDNKRLTSTDFWLEVQKAANPNASIPLDPDGEILIIKPVTEINGNSKDADYPSAKAVYDYGQSIAADTQITATATGKAITIESAKAPLQNLKLYGKTTQDGTPTPDNPIELKSVGDSGSYSVGLYGKNICNINTVNTGSTGASNAYDATTHTITLNADDTGANTGRWFYTWYHFEIGKSYTVSFDIKGTANKLVKCGWDRKGVDITLTNQFTRYSVTLVATRTNEPIVFYSRKTAEGGLASGEYMQFANVQIEEGTQATPYEPFNQQLITFTDTLRGIGDIADEKDFARGVKIQRMQNAIPSNFGLAKCSFEVGGGYFGACITSGTGYPAKVGVGISSHFPMITWNDIGQKAGVYIGNYATPTHIFVPETIASDVATLKQWLIDNDVKIYYPLKEPIETPISETELNAYRQLHTNKPTTTILSEADMEIDYYINKPNAQAIGNIHSQINKDYFKLQQAIISTGGSTL
jgi:hypothetical protein